MTKHTPGPWGVKYSTKRNGGPFEGWTEYDIHSHEGCFLVLRQYPGGDEADANAALMAAAPDLLEALRGLRDTILTQSLCPFELRYVRQSEFDKSHDVECNCTYHDAARAAMSAIAKAEGR